MLLNVAEGCKDELKRQKLLLAAPGKVAEKYNESEEQAKWLVKRSKDIGQKAASTLVQWAGQEQ